MKKSLLLPLTSLLLLLNLSSAFAFSFAASANHITSIAPFIGRYECQGNDPAYGGEYTSTLTISTVSGENDKLGMIWRYAHGGGSAQGTGFVSNGILVLAFEGVASSSPGIASYVLAEDRQRLAGRFTYLFQKDTAIGSESCQRDKESR